MQADKWCSIIYLTVVRKCRNYKHDSQTPLSTERKVVFKYVFICLDIKELKQMYLR